MLLICLMVRIRQWAEQKAEDMKSDKPKGLTQKRIDKLLRNGTCGRYRDSGPGGVKGLRLDVQSRTNASWCLVFQINNKPRQMGLGSARTFKLDDIRKRALVERQKIDGAERIDPLAVRHAERLVQAKAARKVISFADAAKAFHKQHEASGRNPKHGAQVITTLKTYAFPVLGDLAVDQIDTALVLRVIEPIRATKTETAARVRGRIESVLDWAKVRGYRDGPNPALWKGHLDQVLPARGKIAKVEHHAALPYKEVPAFMQALAARHGGLGLAIPAVHRGAHWRGDRRDLGGNRLR